MSDGFITKTLRRWYIKTPVAAHRMCVTSYLFYSK